jgi:hypothetical protein
MEGWAIFKKVCLGYIVYSSGIQPGVREDTLRLTFLSFKTYYLIHYFGCNLFYLF